MGTSEFFLPLQCIPQGIPRGRRNPVSPVTVSLPLGKFYLLPWHSWAPLCHAVGERTAVIGRPISHHSRPPEGSGSQVLCVCVYACHTGPGKRVPPGCSPQDRQVQHVPSLVLLKQSSLLGRGGPWEMEEKVLRERLSHSLPCRGCHTRHPSLPGLDREGRGI